LGENQNKKQEQPKEVIPLEVQEPTGPTTPAIAIPSSVEAEEKMPTPVILPTSIPATDQDKPSQTDSMEVHKHPHHVTHKKKWGEYVLEFLMLFLAVFLGFLAENIREDKVEAHREKQYIVSLIQDLEDDAKLLKAQIAEHQVKIAMLDSLSDILNNASLNSASGDQLYYFGRLAPRIGPFLINIRTYDQLKNSGNFRLIGDAETSNKIMSYYEQIYPIQQLQNHYENEFDNYKTIAVQVFEPVVFRKQINEKGEVVKTDYNPALQNTNPTLLKQLSVYVLYMNGSRRSLAINEQNLLKAAQDLNLFLKIKYSLE
jgi:hypothetical protein